MRDNTLSSNGLGSFKSCCSLMEDEAVGYHSIKEEVMGLAKVISAGQDDHADECIL